jgi:hypothetical protein
MSVPRILAVLPIALCWLSAPALAQPTGGPGPGPRVAEDAGRIAAGVGPLLSAAIRASHRLEAAARPAHAPSAEPQTRRGWIARHPVLFGALAGGVAGSLAVGLTDGASGHPEPGEAYPMGFGLGAAAGAIVGALVGR